MPLVLGLYVLQRLVQGRLGFLRMAVGPLLACGAAAVMTASPIALYALRHPTEFFARMEQVSIFNKSAGNVTFSGPITGTGEGITLMFNNLATFTFSGGVNINSGTNPAFTAKLGGTVTVTGSTNTLATTTGTALDVENVTIGAGGLTFHSITAGTGEFLGYVLRPVAGTIADRTGRYWTVTFVGYTGSGASQPASCRKSDQEPIATASLRRVSRSGAVPTNPAVLVPTAPIGRAPPLTSST